MTHDQSFTDVIVYPPADHRVLVTVEVHPPTGVYFEIKALLDTGASISHFDRALWPQLGVADIKAGIPTDVSSASQGATPTPDVGYIHDIDVRVLGRALKIPVVLCPTWPEGTPNLLGMEGFFDHWRFAFDHSTRRVYYSAI